MTAWTEPQIEMAVRLWNAGTSASLIAIQMSAKFKEHVTKNGVIGKIKRLSAHMVIPPRATLNSKIGKTNIPIKRRAGDPTRPPAALIKRERSYASFRRLQRDILKPQTIAAPATPPTSKPVHFLDRKTAECPWPLWDSDVPLSHKFCCGASVEARGRYCSYHHGKMFVKSKRDLVATPGPQTIQTDDPAVKTSPGT